MNERSPRGLPASAVSRATVLSGGLAVGLGAVQSVWTHDTFGHLAQGRAIAAHGGPGLSDPFSFWRETPQPWVDYEWGSDLLTWWIYAAGGWNALVVLFGGVDLGNPAQHPLLRANGRQAWFGWPTSPGLEALRDEWLNTEALPAQQAIARRLQGQFWQDLPFIPLGQSFIDSAWRGITGVPKGMMPPPGVSARAGIGVNRGRLPGASPAGWAGSVRFCDPRLDTTMPRPGTIGELQDPSEGAQLKAAPQRSTTAT